MPELRHRARLAAIAGAVLAMGITGATAFGAGAQQQEQQKDQGPLTTDGLGAATVITKGRSSFSAQDGDPFSHLPSARENIEVVSKLEPLSQGPIVPGQIADVAVFKNTAYLMSWNRGSTAIGVTPASTCTKGGFYSVDISNPAAPKELAFRPAEFGTYHGEGAHAITMNTASFKGDVLGVNNEPCVGAGTGGFDLYDVSDPANPKPLVIAAGDKSNPTPTPTNPNPRAKPNSSHSTFLWQAGAKAYAVIVDNIEVTDVDIFDITDPRNPVQIGDFDLETKFPAIKGNSALGNAIFLHDMVVKEIGGRQIMLASYWDGGYIQLDVTDPANPTLVGDTDFGTTDPLTGKTPPEGNGHYAEFSHDNRYMLAADEDFSPFRFTEFRTTTGPNAGVRPAGEFGFTKPIATLDDNNLNGPTVYGGYGCTASAAQGRGIPTFASTGITLGADEESIVVLQRGPVNDPNETQPDGPDAGTDPDPIPACTFQEKAENAEAAGYDAVIIANHHTGAGGTASGTATNPDALLCGSGTGADVYGVCIGHRQFHELFNKTPEYFVPYQSPPSPNEPTRGQIGEKVSGSVEFDGWGYAHVYDRATGQELGAYAIEEALDERFAFGFGDLSIHEWATDPTENLAYSAYYSGGIRVAQFGDFGIKETGKFIDVGGSNFWGIEQFTTASGERLLAGSDRDFGLYLLRYTGPGAAKPPVCQDVSTSTSVNKPVSVPLTCTDANGNTLTLSIATQPANGTLSGISGNAVTYTPKAGFVGADVFTYRASDGAANSAPATVKIQVVPGPPYTIPDICGFLISGTPGKDLLNGTKNRDTIRGRAGDDTIAGLQGDDCLFGDAGDDRILGGSGSDRIEGGDGKDRLFGDTANDTMRGGRGVDNMRGGSGNDRLVGGSGSDFLSGGSNNDRLSGGSGNDSLRGDSGNDRVFGGSGNDAIDVGKGRNSVSAGSGKDRINTVNGQRDTVRCGSGRDVVRADRGDRVSRDCERVLRTRTTRRS